MPTQTSILRRRLHAIGPATLVAALAASAACASASTFVPLDPTAAYVMTYNDSPTPAPALALDLAAYGFAPGDRLLLQVVGDIDNGPGGDTFTFTSAVFSSSNVLLDNSQRYRVVGALASDGPAVVTQPTYSGAKPTDIPEDFGFDSGPGVIVTVPVGANYLFLAKTDQWYHDNSDPDHDYGVRIALAPVPEPATWALWAAGILLAGRRAARRP